MPHFELAQLAVENAKASMDVEVPLHYNIFPESVPC